MSTVERKSSQKHVTVDGSRYTTCDIHLEQDCWLKLIDPPRLHLSASPADSIPCLVLRLLGTTQQTRPSRSNETCFLTLGGVTGNR